MGRSLFDRFENLTKIADEILGYSIKQLCLENPSGNLNKTQYTQPALYFVNALSYYSELAKNDELPDFVAGHSLGEYNALMASGVFSFDIGLKLVKQRGLLMSRVSGGAMAAVLGISDVEVKNIIVKNNLTTIDIANLNEPTQTVISGMEGDIANAEKYFNSDKIRFIPLNTSGAFHSRYMQNIREEFGEYLKEFNFTKLNIPVISNTHARPYIQENIVESLTRQITSPVKWTETIQYLMGKGDMEFVEIGNGVILSGLIKKIKNSTTSLSSKIESDNIQPFKKIYHTDKNISVNSHNTTERRNIRNERVSKKIFMYGGQGSHYFKMGKELYKDNKVFQSSMNQCSEILDNHLNRSIVDEIYLNTQNSNNFDNILVTHAAIFCVEYSLTQVLLSQRIRPDAVIGYSIGEYVAAVVAGMMSLKDALKLTALQAILLNRNNDKGSMLVVLSDVSSFQGDLYSGCTLAGINYENNFVVSGKKTNLAELQIKLNEVGVVSEFLEVKHAFHSSLIDPIKEEFNKVAKHIELTTPKIPVYSSQEEIQVVAPEPGHLWRAIRSKVNFKKTIIEIQKIHDFIYIDLSPTATLSNIIKYGFSGSVQSYFAVNRFSQNSNSVNSLISRLKEIDAEGHDCLVTATYNV